MNVAIIFAGGIGSRMGNTIKPKQFLEIDGKAIIIHSILNFEQHKEIDAIAVVCSEDWQEYFQELLVKENIKKVKWIVPGGETGQQSIYNGINAVYMNVDDVDDTIVLISDGVRPNVSQSIITKNIESVKTYGTSATSTYVAESIIKVDLDGKVTNIPDRDKTMSSKAPQGFRLRDIWDVHQKAIAEGNYSFKNSVELMLNYGKDINVVEDTAENIKITTPVDLFIYSAIVERDKNK